MTTSMVYGQITSTYNVNAEGWTTPNDADGSIGYSSTGGNPGGHVFGTPFVLVLGMTTFYVPFNFVAPLAYRGNQGSYYNGTLHYEIQQSSTGLPNSYAEVIITNNSGISLYYFPSVSNQPPAPPSWGSYNVALDNTLGHWKTTNSISGPGATEAQLLGILSDLANLEIRGLYRDANTTNRLDNVSLTPPIIIDTQPVSQNFTCNGGIVTLATSASGNPGLVYKWQVFNEGTGVYDDLSDTGGYSGSSTANLSINTTGGFGKGNYRCKISGTYASDVFTSSVYIGNSGPGALENTFTPVANSPSNYSEIDDMIIQPDGKILLNFFETGGSQYNMCRLLSNGSLDPAFTQWSFAVFSGRADRIALQADGKVLLVGRFTNIAGTNYGRIVRFNSNGTIDASFNSSQSGFNNNVNAIAIQSDNKIVVGGAFTSYNGTLVNRIIRLNSNGSIDGSFGIGTGFNGSVNSIQIQPNGQLLVGGVFTTYNSSSVQTIIRLNANGSVDSGFTVPTTAGNVNVIAIQPDGKIVHDINRTELRRLNANGSLDNTFDDGTGTDAGIYKILFDPSGKILIGGWFQNYNGSPRNFIARLYPDGSLDNFFNVGVGANSLVTSIAPISGSRVMAAGYFDRWNNLLQNGIAVVDNNCVPIPTAIDNSSCLDVITISACGGSNGQYQWYTVPSGGTPITGETNGSLSISSFAATTTYYVTLRDAVCESPRVPVVATKIPSGITPPVTTSASSCSPAALTLTASGSTNGNYRWYTSPSGGVAIAGQVNNSLTTPVLSVSTTYYVAINNGTCESSRTAVTATVTIVAQPSTTDTSRCNAGTVTLTAGGGTNGQYRWYTVASGGTAIIGETSSSYTTPVLAGTTTYYVSINNGTCESTRTSVVATINTAPTAPTSTGGFSCSSGAVTLSAAGGINGNYVWYDTPTGGTSIPGQVNSMFTTPVISSTTTYYVAINDGICESTRTPVIATIGGSGCSNSPPIIATATTSTTIAGIATFDLNTLINDVDGNLDPNSIKILIQPMSGASASITNGILNINYFAVSFAGQDRITIEACDIVNVCTQQEFIINVDGDVIIYNGISPNGDLFNSKWIIQNIETLPDTKENKVTIYNRWGDLVFEVENYDNNTRVFNGMNKNGNEVTSGIYFYKIEFNSARQTLTGYLTVKK